MQKNLFQIHEEHNGYSSDKWELYLHEYDRIFFNYRQKPISLLEIGIQNGGSLEIWEKYFSRAESIIGCDIDPKCKELRYNQNKIKVITGDATDSKTVHEIFKQTDNFDIIIDDGSHKSSDVIKSFATYFPFLNDNGVYVIEDIHCSYWREYQGGLLFHNSSVSFFKLLCDVINYEHWGVPLFRNEIIDIILKKYDCEIREEVLSQIHSIEFINSMCIVKKQKTTQNLLGIQCVSGIQEPVLPGRKKLNGSRNSVPQQVFDKLLLENLYTLIADKQTAIVENEKKIADQNKLISNLNLKLKNSETELFHARSYEVLLKSSLSWIITAPIRKIDNAFKITNIIRYIDYVIKSNGGFTKSIFRSYGMLFEKNAKEKFLRVLTGIFLNQRYLEKTQPVCEENTLEFTEIKISILIPVFNTPKKMLKEAINSVFNQSYKNWELVIINDGSHESWIEEILFYYEKRDTRIKLIKLSRNSGISIAINRGLEVAAGEYYTVLDHDDTLAPSALSWVAKTAVENPGIDYIYSDEDKLTKDGKSYFGSFYKPDWSPEYMLAMMYTCHMSVFRTALVRFLGGYRSEYDGAQDYDLALRVISNTKKIIHIPKVLYHWRVWENSTAMCVESKPLALDRAKKALLSYLDSKKEKYDLTEGPIKGHFYVKFLPKQNDLVSIIIPTANSINHFRKGLKKYVDELYDNIVNNTEYTNYEIIIIHNGNLTGEQLYKYSRKNNVTLVEYIDSSFNLAKKINLGVKHAKGKYLLLSNDDIQIKSRDWLEKMLGMAQRDGVGIVGAKLLFPNRQIQHAGVVMLGGLPGHCYYQWSQDADGYGLSLKVDRNYIAVTGAFSLTPKALFDELGGYNENYPLNYNDIDYCLRAQQLGFRSVYLANVEIIHYEGVTKDGGRSVNHHETEMFLNDWGDIYSRDPYYNINLPQREPYVFN